MPDPILIYLEAQIPEYLRFAYEQWLESDTGADPMFFFRQALDLQEVQTTADEIEELGTLSAALQHWHGVHAINQGAYNKLSNLRHALQQVLA